MNTTPTAASDAQYVELKGLKKSFKVGNDTVTAVNGLDLTVGRGQIVAFLGPNGAGKTTTLDIVLGLTKQDSGSASVMGKSPRKAVLDGHISAVLQSGGLLRDLSVAETVRYIASTFKNPRPVDEVIQRAGLTKIAKRRVSKCSGGEQQRLRFALALLPDPNLLILDEPTAGMDVTARREFWDTMKADAAGGRTVIFATHYLEEAENFAERIVMVSGGKVVADGPTDQIREQNSGRTLHVDLPEAAEAFEQQVRALPTVTHTERQGQRLSIRASNTDATALSLLTDLKATNLEISAADLESAFVALTGAAPSENDNETASKESA